MVLFLAPGAVSRYDFAVVAVSIAKQTPKVSNVLQCCLKTAEWTSIKASSDVWQEKRVNILLTRSAEVLFTNTSCTNFTAVIADILTGVSLGWALLDAGVEVQAELPSAACALAFGFCAGITGGVARRGLVDSAFFEKVVVEWNLGLGNASLLDSVEEKIRSAVGASGG